MELKYRIRSSVETTQAPPNCTLVELKYEHRNVYHITCGDSKLYLSGIEIGISSARPEGVGSPNCTLVELKFDTRVISVGWTYPPNCTLVELKYKANPTSYQCCDSKLYLSGIEILVHGRYISMKRLQIVP